MGRLWIFESVCVCDVSLNGFILPWKSRLPQIGQLMAVCHGLLGRDASLAGPLGSLSDVSLTMADNQAAEYVAAAPWGMREVGRSSMLTGVSGCERSGASRSKNPRDAEPLFHADS
jgi:hypothetical protein